MNLTNSTPIISRAKNPKSQEIGIEFTTTDCSNFDKRCSDAHFMTFLFYYYCNDKDSLTNLIKIETSVKL